MKAILFFIALVVCLAVAQEVINGACYSVECRGRDQVCGTIDSTNFKVTGCKDDLQCRSGTCQDITYRSLNQACDSNSVCRDSNYAITCDGSNCKYAPGIGPGDSNAATCNSFQNNYIGNNPCATLPFNNGTAASCSNSCGNTLAASGATCSSAGTNGQLCASGLYCSFSGQCASRLTSGASCNSTSQCEWSSICTSRGGSSFTCQPPFSQNEGAGCLSVLDCSSGLFCSSSSRTCQRPNRKSCTVDNDGGRADCDADHVCVCTGGGGRTSGRCEALTISSSEISDYRDYKSCMSSNCLYDITFFSAGGLAHSTLAVSYTPDSCAARRCSGSVNGYLSEANGGGSCGSSAALFTMSSVLLLVLLIALWM